MPENCRAMITDRITAIMSAACWVRTSIDISRPRLLVQMTYRSVASRKNGMLP